MIYLNNGVNSITVTLYEKSTQAQPYYTFNLQRKGTFENITFYQDDNSYAPYYWNSFTVSVGVNLGLTAGSILASAGEYTYTVYEMPAPYMLATSSAFGVVETGICIINGTYSNINSYNGTINDTISYYKSM